MKIAEYSATTISATRTALHGISRAAIAKVQGNKTSSAFWSGFVTSGFSVGNKGYGGVEARTAIMAIVGGTTSELSGGKFANSAVTGAFVHLFNAEGDRADYAMKKSLYGEQRLYDRQKNAEKMSNASSYGGKVIAAYGIRMKNPTIIVIGEGIDYGSTIMKYHVSPDPIDQNDVFNNVAPLLLQTTKAH